MRKLPLFAALAVTVLALAGCAGGASSSGTSDTDPVKLTLWHNFGTQQNAIATQNLTDAYTKLHPNVTFDVVSQPGDNYFSLIQASAISKTGPDLAVMWTGLFTLKYKDLLVNLDGLVPAADLAKVDGLDYVADGFDSANGPYVMPFEKQFYMGFYSKKAFAAAGISSVPTNWSELYAACDKLNAAGITPVVYGNGGQTLGATFYTWYDASYAMIGAYTVDEWANLLNGTVAWDSQKNIDQLTKWAAMKTNGCTNSDVLTKTDNLEDFTSGKAAMIIDGTWDTALFTDAMGTDVAAFVPPFSDTSIKGVVEFPGNGFGIMKSSTHQQAAADFLAFLTTDAAVKIMDESGLISSVNGAKTSNPVNQEMLDFAGQFGFTRYPMIDNVIQGDVVDVGGKVLPSVLGGNMTPKDALAQMAQAWNQLPAEQKK
ncbi:sugar ABC transporter substrate-binding protein [Alpinimonas psychrophila]|uniref:Raffinose/stachyose/melibiose transport system substrate-binding protein n=1 Tax=Alpinimonas psychrophila TaxID=748908 RepID=A0A7W3JUX5_9MICO|nr:extracellular solute-binding protein [Alpinimonas psychrophila]MBA8829632.1 raffinose/stachyose/melibiose transport system substrate-binding protein [Alpinimonas psychrophila]